ncbi:hypothetical protein BJ956_000807 [Arthrobacter psychrochitiniphilus]|nr:hypothetical protein [Arthrobacter psychrochitiniphilus]
MPRQLTPPSRHPAALFSAFLPAVPGGAEHARASEVAAASVGRVRVVEFHG